MKLTDGVILLGYLSLPSNLRRRNELAYKSWQRPLSTVLQVGIYGVTWSQVYSYYNSHCSRDRWPLKSFVAFLMLVDTANLVFIIYPTYHLVITNFGVYRFAGFPPWSQGAIALSTIVLEVCVQNFYAYRIYCLGWRSPYLPAAISIISLTEFSESLRSSMPNSQPTFVRYWSCVQYRSVSHNYTYSFPFFLFLTGSAYSLKHTHDLVVGNFPVAFIVGLSNKVLCDVLITVGMVYTLLSNRTQVRRTNSVLNLLAIYAINCGTLHLVFTISCLILFVKNQNTLKYTPSLFIGVRLSLS
ncbi:hypothetical protein EDB87DRAFT_138580 [Lactarius vividus]|nr:hypothetical protein EDB87DRAFT_138580 [Lactarius vividus]